MKTYPRYNIRQVLTWAVNPHDVFAADIQGNEKFYIDYDKYGSKLNSILYKAKVIHPESYQIIHGVDVRRIVTIEGSCKDTDGIYKTISMTVVITSGKVSFDDVLQGMNGKDIAKTIRYASMTITYMEHKKLLFGIKNLITRKIYALSHDEIKSVLDHSGADICHFCKDKYEVYAPQFQRGVKNEK